MTACKRTAVGILPTAKNPRTVRFSSVGYSSVAVLLRAIKGKPETLLPVAVFLPQAQNLRTVRAFSLKILNSLLPKKDEKLPFTWHVISKQINFVEYLMLIVFMGAKKIVVSYPESQIIVDTVDVIKSVCAAVRHRDMMWVLCLLNLREEAFLGRVFKSILKKSIVNSR